MALNAGMAGTADGPQRGRPAQQPLLLATPGPADPASCWGEPTLPTAGLGWHPKARPHGGWNTRGVDTTYCFWN